MPGHRLHQEVLRGLLDDKSSQGPAINLIISFAETLAVNFRVHAISFFGKVSSIYSQLQSEADGLEGRGSSG